MTDLKLALVYVLVAMWTARAAAWHPTRRPVLLGLSGACLLCALLFTALGLVGWP